jgi:CubicO group peptidase (beta-lactamase class C family)
VVESVADVMPDLEARAASFVEEHRLAGAAVGVVRGDDLAWSAGFGFAEVGARQLPQVSTLYRVASITKTFTGTAIMQLCQAGRLYLDDPAVAHLPELRRAASPFGPVETVTIRRMLSHESGLASDPPGTDWAVPAYEGVVERTLGRAADIGTKVPVNVQHKYSNLAYQLLGEIVARASRTPYPQYVKEAILDPLAMSATGFGPLPPILAARRAAGYSRKPFCDELELAPDAGPEWAEGGLWSSVEDLARWLSFQLGAYRDPRRASPVLEAAQLRVMHKPRYLGDDAWTLAWGISWYAQRRGEAVWIQHSGDVDGFSASVCFDPHEQLGAIVLLNGTGDAAALAMDLAALAKDAIRARPAVMEPPAPVPEAFRPLLGVYALPGQGLFIRLEWRDGKLTFVDPDAADWRPTLAPAGDPGTFVVEPGCREAGETVTFHRRADGRVVSVFLAATTFARLDRVPSAG